MLSVPSDTKVVLKGTSDKPVVLQTEKRERKGTVVVLEPTDGAFVETGEPTAKVVGTVGAPLDVVWQLFKPFGAGIMSWWPIYDWVQLEPPGIDAVGAVRHFKTNGTIYWERLVHRNDKTHTEQYAYIDSSIPEFPFYIKNIITTVTMREVSPLVTEVTWSSKTDANPLLIPLMANAQRSAYYAAITGLARYFNPATEVVEVKVVSANLPRRWGFFPPSAYVAASVGDAPPKRTWVWPLTTRPTWNDTVKFNVGVLDREVGISVWDARIGADALIGNASVDISKVTPEWTDQTLDLPGPQSGQVKLSVRAAPEFQVLRDAMSLTKRVATQVGDLAPWVAQLGFEIGMVDTTLATIEQKLTQQLQGMGLKAPLTDGSAPGNLPGAAMLDFMSLAGKAEKTIQGLTDQLLVLAKTMVGSIQKGEVETYEYDRYPAPNQDLPRMVKGLPVAEFLPPAKLGGMVQMGMEYAYSQFKLLDRYVEQVLKLVGNKKDGDPYEAFMFNFVKRPNAIVDNWQDDVELCRQLIQGVNPLVIQSVQSTSQIPLSLRNLSAQGKSLQELIDERRLFILDYDKLAPLKPYRDMVFYAPIVLVYRELLEEGESRLNLVGFQLTRNEGLANVVYTADNSPPNRYLYAKIQVACADNQYHQWISHLGFAHLASEPFMIAYHNVFQLPKNRDHVIGKLLAPHMRETLGINYLARQTLVTADPSDAFTDKTFSTGTAQALTLFLAAWREYDFFKNSFPEQLAARGFDEQGTDGVRNYYYRDDGFKIWRALESYVKEVVEARYRSDETVLADPVLQRWAHECSAPDRADIPGFPRGIVSRAQLVKTLTTLIFQVSAFHSVVNFPQRQYLAYVPNRPDSTFARMPDGEDDITMEFILLNALPNLYISNFQISFAHLLTLPSDAPLSSIPAVEEKAPYLEIRQRFQASLDKITAEIKERNAALVADNKQPYPYLSPDRIASSVAI